MSSRRLGNQANFSQIFIFEIFPGINISYGINVFKWNLKFFYRFPKQYPENAECTWEITAQPGFSIGLYFVNRFSLETSDSCKNDFVQVRNFTEI